MRVRLYEKVFEDLFTKIKSKYYKPGELLPSEQELETIYKVSRAPIRQALGMLETDGLITRQPGKGTFVSRADVNLSKVTLGGFGIHFSSKWEEIRCKTCSVDELPAEDWLSNLLTIQKKQAVVKTSRVRYVNDEPTFYLNHYSHKVDADYIKSQGDFPNMRQLLEEYFGHEIVYVKEEISVTSADQELAKWLEIEEGYPLLHVERQSFDGNYQPIEYVDYFVKQSKGWNYQVVFNKKIENTDF